MKKALIAMIGIGLLAVSGYAQSNLGGVRWELTELNGSRVNGSRAFIEFDESTSRISGNAGCNRFFGGYELRGARFKADRIGTTRMACTGDGAARTEAAFLEALKDANRLRRNGAVLTLNVGGRSVLKFQRAKRFEREPVTMDLTSKKWILRSINGRAVSLAKGAAFLNFDAEKGSAGGNSGCNVFGGDYEALGASIKFGDMISTMMACEFENRMQIELGFLDGLRRANRFEIKGDRLKLLQGPNVLLEFEGVAK